MRLAVFKPCFWQRFCAVFRLEWLKIQFPGNFQNAIDGADGKSKLNSIENSYQLTL